MEIKLILVSNGQEQEIAVQHRTLLSLFHDIIDWEIDQIKFQVWMDGHLRQEKVFSLSESNYNFQ